jgi:hypothetical protein
MTTIQGEPGGQYVRSILSNLFFPSNLFIPSNDVAS